MDTYNDKYIGLPARMLQNSITHSILAIGITAIAGGFLLDNLPVMIFGFAFIALWLELVWLFIPIIGVLLAITVSPLSYLSRQWLQIGLFHLFTAFGLSAFLLKILNWESKLKLSYIDVPFIMIVPVLALSIIATKQANIIVSLKHLFSFYGLIGFYFIVRVFVNSERKFKLSYYVFISTLLLGSLAIFIELFFDLRFGRTGLSFEDAERISGIAGRANAAGFQSASFICLLLPFLFTSQKKNWRSFSYGPSY